ncbi:integrin alpha-3 isoform X2 [Kryptolebias marmoratus]|uniref:integrin alpha-3 isoform X2 n=1 Tax=Kryptolebias marmoratus TaxID=37003 RepID=UPI0007F8F89D|nr:integrin alpha-3 isoform X2 [Kryptolebias marmoratus]
MATGVCAVLSVCASVCVAFNVDTSFAVLKTGEAGSLFGFSVALHEDLKTRGHLLFIGAPRARAEPHIPANRTGGVYRCPVTSDQSDCTRMNFVYPEMNLAEDLVEDMWLGVSVFSQGQPGGKVLACGHRFIKLSGVFRYQRMIGQCYLRVNDLLDDGDMNWQKTEQICHHKDGEAVEGMCNMGISAFMSDTEIIVGSPGSYEWQGNVHVLKKNPYIESYSMESQFTSLQRRNIYIGYSVTQARRLLSAVDDTIVTGAPRDSKDDARGSVLLVVKQSRNLVTEQTLRGRQVGSYFGNAVVALDLNSDGWNDLLVSAPFYFSHQPEAGGAVYVFMNAGGKIDSEPSVVLMGPAGSAFGMALISAGDLNQDGFQDFAVGAPFHDTGSVMIWTGSNKGVSTEPSQVIRGSSVSPGFKTFGYSLAAGLDVDGNKYPDLLVGSLDDSVALLRSRPVVHLNKTLRVSPGVVDPNSCDFCIQVKVCFSYKFNAGEKSKNDNITVLFTVTADVTSLKPRLLFQNNGNTVYSSFLSMPKKKCETLTVGLLRSVQNKVEPLVFSLNASLYEKLPEKGNHVQDLRHLPVLNQTPRPVRTQIHIQKACGSDNHCHSNLQMSARFVDENQKPFRRLNGDPVLDYNTSIRWLLLEVNVTNTPSADRLAEDAHNAVLNISIPPELTFSRVAPKADGSTVECSVRDIFLLCQLGNPFRSNQKDRVLIKFQPSENILDTKELRSQLQLSTLSEQSDLSPVSASLLVEYSLQASLVLIGPPDPIFFSGHVIGEEAMKKTEDIGSLVVFTLQVYADRKSLGRLGNLEVEFDWPKEVSNGKWLLYLTEIQFDHTSNPHCTQTQINPLNLLTLNEDEKRMRRALKEEKKKQEGRPLPVFSRQEQKKSYKLSCSDGARCVKISCPLLNTNSSVTLMVRSRLWNSTMIEDYSDARSVLVRVQASLKLKTNKSSIKMKSPPSEIEVFIYPDSALQVHSGAPLWIIVVSVLAGVLLLALICLLLWKCGFFKRASTRETYEAKSQRAQKKSQPSESDKLTEEL